MSAAEEKLDLRAIVAMGVGAMIGGGIFSVLGLAISVGGHAAPVVFAIGGLIALVTGFSYARLGLAFHSAGGSFTYLEHAFANRNIAGMGGWLLLAGYVGTMGLYAYTFGAYGAPLLGAGTDHLASLHHLLSSAILLFFLGINLYSVATSGKSEVLIVITKVTILLLFGILGLTRFNPATVSPLFDRGVSGALIAAALIFVAYEGFELIPNAVSDMRNPQRDLGRGIFVSIVITIAVYVLVALVAVGNLTPEEIQQKQEYALAVAAQPFLGNGGFVLISLSALLSTASAINATMFGTARLAMTMSLDEELPRVFSFRERSTGIPWVALVVITLLTLAFVNLANLRIISSAASATFLLVFFAINLSAFRLRRQIGLGAVLPLSGCAATAASLGVLLVHLARWSPQDLYVLGGSYATIIAAELLFSQRRLVFRPAGRSHG